MRMTLPCILTLAIAALASAQSTTQAVNEWEARADAIVAADGSGKFRTVQAAIDNSSPEATPEKPWIIYVKAGEYRELIYIQREKRHTILVGEDANTTKITFNLVAGMPNADGVKIGTFRTPTVVVDADDFTIRNITIENSAGARGQALALRVDGDRVRFFDCRFTGWQDTIFLNRGRQYFENCYIAGATDFIFGGATAWFENCHIHCAGSGYITAASTPQLEPYGFVFNRCRITGENEKVRTVLGRPWRGYASTIFMNTEMSSHVAPAGWNNWSRPQREQTARYMEYNSTGPGGNMEQRVGWAKRLTDEQAREITIDKVLGGEDGWNPK